MKINNKIIHSKILYIFFTFLSLILFFFSTVNLSAKAFNIDNIEHVYGISGIVDFVDLNLHSEEEFYRLLCLDNLDSKELKDLGFAGDIAIDGGVNAETGKLCRDAGADILIAGSYIFGAKDRIKAITSLRG